MTALGIATKGFILQEKPQIICAMLPGRWLLKHTTPSWRYDDPIEGFQRMVRKDRAEQIALAVLSQGRTFPNAIVLATDVDTIGVTAGEVEIPENIKFLVVDGQHRLWAQYHSSFDAPYGCMIHTGLSQEDMARLFIEINDTQKRVPASLRWDLLRLIKPDDDEDRMAAVEIVFLLATENDSPFYQRIDLTGEQSELQIKQASLAPEFRDLLRRHTPLADLTFVEQYQVILHYSNAIREVDTDRWGKRESAFFKARVLRSLFRMLTPLVNIVDPPTLRDPSAADFIPYLQRINEETLDPETIRSMQGSAGIAAIYRVIRDQMIPESSPL